MSACDRTEGADRNDYERLLREFQHRLKAIVHKNIQDCLRCCVCLFLTSVRLQLANLKRDEEKILKEQQRAAQRECEDIVTAAQDEAAKIKSDAESFAQATRL